MSPASDFAAFYEKELKELLLPLEEERKKIKRLGIAGFICIGVSLVFFILAASTHAAYAAIIAFIVFIPAIICLVLYGTGKNKFTRQFKNQIVAKIIAFIDPALHYSPDSCISKTDYTNSGLYVSEVDRYSGDDYVEGTHDKTFFCFSELHTEREVSSGKQKHWETVFKGLFIMADFNKHFAGRTYVWSESRPQLNFLNKLFSSFSWNLEKVKLEGLEFEKCFIVYSNDQVEARYILTPSFMERAVRLQKLMGEGTALSFINSNINIAIPMKEDLFEPAVFGANDFSRLEQFRLVLKLIYDIIDELQLNDRLWTKE